MIHAVWVVSYYDEGGAPVVTVFDNEFAAKSCYEYFLRSGKHTKVDIDLAHVYQSFTVLHAIERVQPSDDCAGD